MSDFIDLPHPFNELFNGAYQMHMLGDNDRAKLILIYSIRIARRTFGSFSQRVALAAHLLGKVAAAMGQRDEAVGYFGMAAHIRESGFRIDLSLVLHDLGVVLVDLWRTDEGIEILKRTLRIRLNVSGDADADPLVAETRRELAHAYFQLGDYRMYCVHIVASWRVFQVVLDDGVGNTAPAA